jgi:hypothetical protein
MAKEDEVARLKKELKEMAEEFRKYRDKTKKQPQSDVEGQSTEIRCDPCVTWTMI